jgi:glucokinase
MILAGDIGGTKCNLALVERQGEQLVIRHRQRFSSRDYAQFSDIVAAFLAAACQTLPAWKAEKLEAAGFGVAGPVIGKRVRVTNLNWELDAEALGRQAGTSRVALLNDLEATGYGLPWLAPDQLRTLNAGKPRPRAAMALIAAGTGLGESLLHWDGHRYIVAPTEGGHCDFAPRTDQEIELLRYLMKIERPVSWEMLLSGRGFQKLHEFLNAGVRHPAFDNAEIDSAPEVTRRALEGSCPVCVCALDLWVSLYGAEAGNLALKTLSLGGVFVAGGIAAKILPKMCDGTFLRAFCRKSKFSALLAEVPVHVVLSEETPLLGAAAEAVRLS